MDDSWVRRAACGSLHETLGGREKAVNVFYPQRGSTSFKFRDVCRGCEVRCECLTWSVLAEDHGGWAGTSAVERRMIRDEVASGLKTFVEILAERQCDATHAPAVPTVNLLGGLDDDVESGDTQLDESYDR